MIMTGSDHNKSSLHSSFCRKRKIPSVMRTSIILCMIVLMSSSQDYLMVAEAFVYSTVSLNQQRRSLSQTRTASSSTRSSFVQQLPHFSRFHHLKSTTSSNNEQKELSSNNNEDSYLSKYPTIRSLNDALQKIVNECSNDTRKIKFDIISRAASAEALVSKLSSTNEAPYQPNETTYYLLLKIWSKTAHVLAEGSGRGDINEVYHAEYDDFQISPELIDEFNHICTARDAAEHATSLLSSMECRFLTGQSGVQPSCRGYNTVMDGWNKSRARDASEHIQKLFLRMKVWSSRGVTRHIGIEDGVDMIHTDVEEWKKIKPNAITHSITIESFRSKAIENKIGDVDDLVAALEKDYEETGDASFKPDIGVANSLIKSYMRSADYSSGGGGKYQQSMVNTSWKTAKKIYEIYTRWKKKYKTTGDVDFKPTVATVNMVIDAYSRCGDVSAAERAQQIFDSMVNDWKETNDYRSKPMAKTFTALITAWAKSRDPKSAEKGEELIQMMEQLYKEDVKEGSSSQLFPLSQTYTAAINAWARSNDNNKPKRALRLLKKVSDTYKETKDKRIQPSLYTYNAAIDACAKCHGTPSQQAEALKIAFAVNKAITASKMEANHVTYTTLLKTVNALLDPGKEKSDILTAVFTKAKNAGYVDYTVLKTLKMSCDQGLFNELLEEARDKAGYVDFDLIPSQWCRNIKK